MAVVIHLCYPFDLFYGFRESKSHPRLLWELISREHQSFPLLSMSTVEGTGRTGVLLIALP